MPLANDFGGLDCQIAVNQPISAGLPSPAVYFICIGKFIKIGVTTNLTERLKTFQCVTVQDVEVLLTIPGDRDLEGRLHTLFEKLTSTGGCVAGDFRAYQNCSKFFLKEFAAMTKKRAHMARITFEVTPGLSAFLTTWAREEGRSMSGLLRHVLTGIADEKIGSFGRNATRQLQTLLVRTERHGV